jgi:GT2 family glycosyltransferase
MPFFCYCEVNDQMADNPLVFIIIVTYNGIDYLKNCLSSLKSQTYSNFKIIICDNASKDGTVEFLTKNYPDLTIIENGRNLGFALANNIAIDSALNQGAEYIFLLNNDAVVESDSLEKLIQAAKENDSIGIIGPMVMDLKNKNIVQEIGMTCDKFGYPMPIKSLINKNQTISEVFFISGCALLIKKDVLQKIGRFDCSYFMFAEDLDLCWRAQLAGYKIAVNRQSIIYHVSGGSMVGGVVMSAHYKTDVRRIFLREKNTLRTLIKNYDSANMLRIIPFYAVLLIIESMFWFLIQKPQTGINILKAIVWNLKALPSTMRGRTIVQRLRKISDREITKNMVCGYIKLSVFRAVGVPEFANSKKPV